MKRKFISWIIVLLAICLLGIILVQVFWIRNAISIKEEQFDRAVNESIYNLGSKVDFKDALIFISDKIIWTDAKPDSNHTLWSRIKDKSIVDYQLQDSLFSSYRYTSDADSLISEYQISANGKATSKVITYVSPDNKKSRNESKIIVEAEKTNGKHKFSKEEFKYRIKKIDQAFQEMVFEYGTKDVVLKGKTHLGDIRDIIKKEFANRKIDTNFEAALVHRENEISYLQKTEGFIDTASNYVYKAQLFPDKLFNDNKFVYLFFPDKSSLIFKSLRWLIAGAFIFTLIIILTFGFTVHTILRQKKVSEIKSDFINNMTHEFKTPIATISLAADSIMNSKIISRQEQVKYYAGIIKEENKRMNTQVENVLKMSLIDRKELELRFETVDMHEIIHRAVKSILIQVEKSGGTISTELYASDSFARVDEIHMVNVLYNLVDNAIKYSAEKPEIQIRTRNQDTKLIIDVEDHGIGMEPEVQNKIFDKFYRESSGNIHNVKGFGLGLSYVKAVLQSCDATITVESKKGKGSIFSILFAKIKTHA